jgi:hypothetical protein
LNVIRNILFLFALLWIPESHTHQWVGFLILSWTISQLIESPFLLSSIQPLSKIFGVLNLILETKVFILIIPFIHQRQIFFISLKLPSGFQISSESDFVLFNFIYFEIFLICFQYLNLINSFHYFNGKNAEIDDPVKLVEPVKNQSTNENTLMTDLQSKLEKVNLELNLNKIDHSKLIEVVENLTLKLSIYESLICEIRPQTTLRELRGKVKEDIPKLEHEIKANQPNLEEITFTSNSSPLPISNSPSVGPSTPKGEKFKRSNTISETDSLHGDQSSLSMKIVGKRKGTEVQVIDVPDDSDDETERDFNENDMNEMLSETNGSGEKKNKDVAFSEKILSSLTAGIKVAVKKRNTKPL